MLDSVAPAELTDQLWTALSSRTTLPWGEGEYFCAQGVSGPVGESRRRYVRFHLRNRAILLRGVERHGVYIKDLSPQGLGLLSPVQIFPKERLVLLLSDSAKLDLELRRCRRVADECYECGTVFIDGAVPPGTFRRLMQCQPRR